MRTAHEENEVQESYTDDIQQKGGGGKMTQSRDSRFKTSYMIPALKQGPRDGPTRRGRLDHDSVIEYWME